LPVAPIRYVPPDWGSPGTSQHFDPYRFGEVLNLSLPELLHRQLAPAADFLKFTGHLDDLLAQLLATPPVDEIVRALTAAREALPGTVMVRFRAVLLSGRGRWQRAP
jgi:hypothetical protein